MTSVKLKVGFINIAGIWKACGNMEIYNILNDINILGLVESWLSPNEKFSLDGYINYKKNRVKLNKFDRTPGGLMMLIQESLGKFVNLIQLLLEECLCVE